MLGCGVGSQGRCVQSSSVSDLKFHLESTAQETVLPGACGDGCEFPGLIFWLGKMYLFALTVHVR